MKKLIIAVLSIALSVGLFVSCENNPPAADNSSPTVYTITLNANGGSGSMDPVNMEAGEYTLPDCGFTYGQKVFDGWALSESGSVLSGTSINISGDVQLYAIWRDWHEVEVYELGVVDVGYAYETGYFIRDLDTNQNHFIYSRIIKSAPSRTDYDAYVEVDEVRTQDGKVFTSNFRILDPLVPMENRYGESHGTFFYQNNSDGTYSVSHNPPYSNPGYTQVTGHQMQVTSMYDFIFIGDKVYSVYKYGGAYTVDERTPVSTGRLYVGEYFVATDPEGSASSYGYRLEYDSNVIYFDEDDSMV